MNQSVKFLNFLESVKPFNPSLVESIEIGFKACFESGVKKEMDHTAYMEKLKDEKKFPDSSLKYIKSDAKKALDAMPDGPNAGYYADEIHYCNMELNRRKKLKDKKTVTEAYEDVYSPEHDGYLPSGPIDELPVLDTSSPEQVI